MSTTPDLDIRLTKDIAPVLERYRMRVHTPHVLRDTVRDIRRIFDRYHQAGFALGLHDVRLLVDMSNNRFFCIIYRHFDKEQLRDARPATIHELQVYKAWKAVGLK